MTVLITKKEGDAILALKKIAETYGVFDKMANTHKTVLNTLIKKLKEK